MLHKSFGLQMGEVTPPPIKQKIIAEFFSRDIEELFPEEEKGVEHALESN